LPAWSQETAIGCLNALANQYGVSLQKDALYRITEKLGYLIPHHVQLFFDNIYVDSKLHSRTQVTADRVDEIYQTRMLSVQGHAELSHMEERLKMAFGLEVYPLALEILTEAAVTGYLDAKAALTICKDYVFEGLTSREVLRDILEIFSEKHCDKCLTKTSKNGKTTWFHNVLEAKLVCSNGFSISLGTEWIENPEGDFEKQDCEQKAFRRLAKKLKKLFPQLPICITADGLYPNQTFFSICKNNNWRLIVTFEDGNLPTVWKTVESLRDITTDNKFSCTIKQQGKTIRREYCWVNGIDYRGFLINWIECQETIETAKSEKSSQFIHITDHKISRDTAEDISFSGRLRWKIENEGFNTQKNLGYRLKHKYSRVDWLASKNYYQCLQIAHLINQLLELNTRFKEQLKGKITIKHLWKCMIGFLIYGCIDTEKLSMLAQLRTQVRFE